MVQIPMHHRRSPLFEPNTLPVLMYAGRIADEPDWVFPCHKHDDLSEIIYISRGQGSFIIDNRRYEAKEGDLLIYNSGVLHEEKSNPENPLATYFCGVGNLAIRGLPPGWLIPASSYPVLPSGTARAKIEGYIRDIFEESHSQRYGFETMCQHLLILLIILVQRIASAHSGEDAGILGLPFPGADGAERDGSAGVPDSLGFEIKAFLDDHYSRNLSLSDIAGQLYLSPYYLSYIFKKETGYSPIQYLIARRIGEAKKLLLTTDLTVQDISREVGYENVNYFITLFKKSTGQTPGQFKQSNRKRG